MFVWDLFKHYLLTKRAGSTVRSVAWLCILGVAVGVFALIVVLSVMNGFHSSIQKRLLAFEPHLVVKFQGLHEISEIEQNSVYKELKSRHELKVQSFSQQDVIVRTNEALYGGAIAHSVETEQLKWILQQVHQAELARKSRSKAEDLTPDFADETLNLAPGEVIIGVDLARSLGIFEGDQIVLISPESLLLPKTEIPQVEKLKVKTWISTNIPEIDSKAIFFSRASGLQHLQNSATKEVGIEIRLEDPNQFEDLKKELQLRDGLQVESWRDRNSSLFYALKLEKFAMGSFLSLSAMIASFSILTVLTLLITQKRKDIGILMTMGLSKFATQRLFLKLGLILASIGLFGGLILGVVVCALIERYPLPLLPDIYYDSTIPAKIDPILILGILVSSIFIAYISAWLPARFLSQLWPAESLRSSRLH